MTFRQHKPEFIMSNAECSAAAVLVNETEGQLTNAINDCFDILHQTFSDIKSILKSNKQVLPIVPKPRQLVPGTPRVRVFIKSIRRKGIFYSYSYHSIFNGHLQPRDDLIALKNI